MKASRKWDFRSKFRANAYGWRGSHLAIDRLKAAVSEIKAVAKTDPVSAGDGVVLLSERLWPALQGIDTSSGALGSAVFKTLHELVPILITAPADFVTRRHWLQRLFEAVQNDGVEYLSPIEERWGEIAQYPELIDQYANLLIDTLRRAWSDHATFSYVQGTSICLSCLLEIGRYEDLQELLAIPRSKFWPWQKFGAQALARQGLCDAAIAFAESARSTTNPGFHDTSIDQFCESILIDQGRADEAYRRYGLRAAQGTTNLAIYRSLRRAYPDRDARQTLLDLIDFHGDKGKWFAAAKDAGFFDIAIECASISGAEPSTLVRAARDYEVKEPHFAATVALLALRSLLNGGGYDPKPADVSDAVKYLLFASGNISARDWAISELNALSQERCAPGRELLKTAIIPAMSQCLHDPGLFNADQISLYARI